MRHLALVSSTLLYLAVAGTSHAAENPPLTFQSSPDKVPLTEGGANRVWYRVSPGKPLRLMAAEPMMLVLTARPIAGSEGDPTLSVDVGGTRALAESLPWSGATVAGPGLVAGPSRMLRVTVSAPRRAVSVSVDRGSALLVFGMQPVTIAQPAATPSPGDATAPPPPPMPMPPIPLIPKQVERLSLIPKIGAMMPLGAVDGPAPGGMDNLYLGAELRYSLPMLERRLSVGADVGTYRVQDSEAIVGTTPLRASVDEEVEVGWRVTPVLASAVYRLAGSKRAGVYAGAGAGVAALSRRETVEFRAPDTTTSTAPAVQARVGVERRAGPGRVVIEASYLHVVNDPDTEPYLGGPLGGIHYRFAF